MNHIIQAPQALHVNHTLAISDWLDKQDLDFVFGINNRGYLVDLTNPPTLGAVTHSNKNDVEINGYAPQHTLWMPITALTNQYGYSGAILHPSETISHGIITRLQEIAANSNETTIFAIAAVEIEPIAGIEQEPAGWCILQYIGKTAI